MSWLICCRLVVAILSYYWATTCDFQQCGILSSVDSDEPLQPPFKLRGSKLWLVKSLVFIEYSSDQQRLLSDCAYVQAGLSLCWSHIPHCWKSHAAAHIIAQESKPCIFDFFRFFRRSKKLIILARSDLSQTGLSLVTSKCTDVAVLNLR